MLWIEKEKCTGCHACATVCPKGCISMEADSEGFLYPAVDRERCVDCGACARVCPQIQHRNPAKSTLAYGAYCRDEALREQSSSGGVFTCLAHHVLRQGGVVFGAMLDSRLNVVHGCTQIPEGLTVFRGAKYAQSCMGSSYAQARDFLEQGKTVLFTGTPCQISGLLAYLHRPYEGLITVDLVCHGVPSPKAWQSYLQYQARQAASPVVGAAFRDKSFGWRGYSLRLSHGDGSNRIHRASADPYMRTFIQNASLRPSCYRCSHKGLCRESDLTLADFWGLEKLFPEKNENKGTSLVLVHSPKGKAIFQAVREQLVCWEADAQRAAEYNPSMVSSATMPKCREVFFAELSTRPFDKVAATACPSPSFLRRVLRKLKRLG